MVNDIKSCLLGFPIIQCLTDGEIDFVTSIAEYKTLNKHDFLFKINEPSDEVYFLVEGVVKVVAFSDDKREVIKNMHHAGNVLSVQSLTGEEMRESSAIAMSSEISYLTVKASYIIELIKSNHKLALCLINFLGTKLSYSEARLASLALSDARTRILDFLRVNAEDFGMKVGYEVLLKHEFTQQDIADFTGTSRQTVTTVLNDLKKSNKILLKRSSILIRDIACLN